MPVVASATLEVTPVLSGAQQSLTDQLTGATESAASEAGEKAGSGFIGSMANGIAAGAAAVTGAVVGVGAALTAVTGATAEYGDSIDKASQKLGVSSTFYQEWEAVLQHSGTSMDKMGASFKKLATESQDASADQQAAFEKLGLSMEQVSQMSAEELFASVVTGLQGMEEGTERTALATTLLGKGAQELGPLFNTTAEDTQGMIDQVNALGGVMSEDAVKASARYQDSLQDMQTAFSGVKNGIGAELLPVFADFMDKISEFISTTDLSPVTDTIGLAVDALGDFISNLDIEAAGETFKSVVEGVGEAVGLAWDVLSIIFGAIKDAIGTVTESMESSGTDWSGVWDGIKTVVKDAADIIASVIKIIGEVIAGLIKEAQTDGTLFNAIWEGIKTVVSVAGDVITGVIDGIKFLLDGDWKQAWEDAKENASETWNNIKDGAAEKLGDMWDTASGIFDDVKGLVDFDWELPELSPTLVTDAVDTVMGAFDTVRDALDFDWSFPHIDLPHFSWSWNDLGIVSIPSISVDWYAKGGIVDDATIIGAGEAGPEAIIPLSGSAMQPFAEAIADNLGDRDEELLMLLKQYLPQLARMSVTLDSGTVVGALAPAMDAKLGILSARKARGN